MDDVRRAVQTLLDYANAKEVDQSLADQLATALENTLTSLAAHNTYVAGLMERYRETLEYLDARENEL